MAVKNQGNLGNTPNLFTGLSTDTKPTSVPLKSEFSETDTSDWYRFDGSSWKKFAGPDSNGGSAANVVAENRQASGAIQTRIITFSAAADMPADITNATLVAADRIEISSIPSTATAAQLIFHGAGGIGGTTNSHQAVSLGSVITVDAEDDATANANLTQSTVTGGGLSSSGRVDTFMLSPAKSERWVTIPDGMTRIDCIGIPTVSVGTPVFIPCYLEINFYG